MQLKKLIKSYSYEEHEDVILKIVRKDITKEVMARSNDIEEDQSYSETFELACLISFLRRYRGQEMKLSCKDERLDNVLLSSSRVQDYLEMWANTLLEYLQDGNYQYLFDWDFKQQIEWTRQMEGEAIIEEDPFYTEPYTDEELNKILKYEEGREQRYNILYKLSDNAQKGKRLKRLNDELNKAKVFCAKTHKEKEGEAVGITQEYAFLYDYLVCIGNTKGSRIYDNADKRIAVRDYINSYERVLANFKKKFGKEKNKRIL